MRSLDRIRLKSVDATNRAFVLHLYGHHILHEMAESPAPDFDNGICDTPSPSSCVWSPENAEVAWTEGWPDFFAGRVLEAFGRPGSTPFENHVDSGFSGQEDRIPGFVTAILHDLADVTNDDQHNDGAGRRDDTFFTFRMLWGLLKNYDPSSSLTHDHPTTIHEFWSGLRVFQHDRINQVSEIYREHHIVKPQPDLIVSTLSNPPATFSRNASFIVNWTVRNLGNEFAHLPATIACTLVNGTQSVAVSSNMFPTLNPDFAAGGTHSGSSVVGISTSAPLGSYLLRACIDSTGNVPESDESTTAR